MASIDPTQQRRYEFSPMERRGLLGPVRGGQAAILTIAVVILGGGLLAAPRSPLLALAALVAALVVAGSSLVRVQGNALDEWICVLAWVGWRRANGLRSWRSNAPTDGFVQTEDGLEPPEVELPPELAGLQVLAMPLQDGQASGPLIGVVKDDLLGTYVGVLEVRIGTSFGLLDAEEQEERLAHWGAILDELAREKSVLRRLVLMAKSVPSDGDELTRYFADERDEAVPLESSAARSYLELLDGASDVTQSHRIYVGVVIDRSRARKQIRKAGGGDEGAWQVLRSEMHGLDSAMASRDIKVEGALQAHTLARLLRDHVDPFGRRGRARMEALAPESVEPSLEAWPLASDPGWGSIRCDSSWHVTYAVTAWPRTSASADFLSPLLMRTGVVRTVTVILEVLGPESAITEAENAVVEDLEAVDRKAKQGFRLTQRRQRAIAAAVRREHEVVAGFAAINFCAFVTASGASADDRDHACSKVEHAGHQSRLHLTRLWGQQDLGLTFTLPLGRGMRR